MYNNLLMRNITMKNDYDIIGLRGDLCTISS